MLGMALLAVVLTLVGLMRFAFPSYREGTYRRGYMWHLRLGSREEVGLPTPAARPAKAHGLLAIALSTAAGIGLVALAPFAWLGGYPVIGILSAVLGLAFLALALADWQENREIRASS